MADEVTPEVAVDAPAPAAVEPTEPVETNGDTTDIPKQDEETADEHATAEGDPPEDEDATEVAEPPSAAAADGEGNATPASAGKTQKRKSTGGAPEHKSKSKKLKKKKSMPTLHLDCKPGEFYWARLRGHPPWPSVVCDEQMLPEALLASRPVSAAGPEGHVRFDFTEGQKNAKERTFPVMFLYTNEFQWMVNTALTPLDPAECTTLPNTKMTNQLKNAWKIASEDHDLDYFKGILKSWQEEQAQIEKELREQEEKDAIERERKALEEAEAAEKAAEEESKAKKKPKSRKSVDMVDGETPKSSKKRKKEADSEGDGAKPKKTPKVTKLNAPKTPNGESAAKKSSAKSKKKVVQAPKEDEEDEKPQMTEAEKMAQREKAVLYLRHRLQKGFLSRDQAPQEAEMAAMADFFSQLEAYGNLEPSIIRSTKVHKVLKAIVKLSSIPKDELYNFKKRSAAMLEIWNKRMEADVESAPPSAVEPKAEALSTKQEDNEPETNGEKATEPSAPVVEEANDEPMEDAETKEGAPQETEEEKVEKVEEVAKAEVAADQIDEKVEEALGEKMDVVVEPPSAPVEKVDPGNDARDEATDGDVAMETKVEEATETV